MEKALLSHLTEFLLELGRGFSFVANQQRIKIGSEYYYPDLVFYNRLVKSFVIINLKIGKLTHQDIGQMQMYSTSNDKPLSTHLFIGDFFSKRFTFYGIF